MVNGVQGYSIQVTNRPNRVFWAGEVVEGVVTLRTTQPLKCRAVKLELSGESRVNWRETQTHGSGDNRKREHVVYRSRHAYVGRRNTLWGNFYTSARLDGAGDNAYFDPHMGTGDMPISLSGAPDDVTHMTLAVRVMDYDWGVKDDLLGEVLVRVADLLASPGAPVLLNLAAPRKKTKGEGKDGQVSLSASLFEHSGGTTTLLLQCQNATGLRKADLLGSNDVYVQAYRVPPGTVRDPKEGLPPPVKNAELPTGEQSFPFSLKIPFKAMPSSNEAGHGSRVSVRYQLYSNVDMAFKFDPCTRTPITVLGHAFPSPSLLSPVVRQGLPPQTIYGCECCCFKCCDKGTAQFFGCLERSCASAGDCLRVALWAHNATEDMACTFRVSLIQRTSVWGHSHNGRPRTKHMSFQKVWQLAAQELPPKATINWPAETPKVVQIPPVPPTFEGSPERDPMVWRYYISFKLDMESSSATDIEWIVPFFVTSMPLQLLVQSHPTVYVAPTAATEQASVGSDTTLPAMGCPPVGEMPSDDVMLALLAPDRCKPFDGQPVSIVEEQDEQMFGKAGVPAWAPSYPVVDEVSPTLMALPSVVPATATAAGCAGGGAGQGGAGGGDALSSGLLAPVPAADMER